jgi:hypothetical protein
MIESEPRGYVKSLRQIGSQELADDFFPSDTQLSGMSN